LTSVLRSATLYSIMVVRVQKDILVKAQKLLGDRMSSPTEIVSYALEQLFKDLEIESSLDQDPQSVVISSK